MKTQKPSSSRRVSKKNSTNGTAKNHNQTIQQTIDHLQSMGYSDLAELIHLYGLTHAAGRKEILNFARDTSEKPDISALLTQKMGG